MQRIIYTTPDNSVCIIAPADGCELSIEQIARKDVPAGTSYDIVDASDPRALPSVTTEQLFATLRAARDARLTATDKYLLADYPINTDNLALIKVYRADLRALPAQPGAPWSGGDIPWPVMPAV